MLKQKLLDMYNKISIKGNEYEIEKLNNKQMYNVLMEEKTTSHNKMESLYNKEFRIDDTRQAWKKIYEQKIVDTKVAKLREFNFKLLHNIAPCGYVLSKWISNISNKCARCGNIETIKHMLFECMFIKNMWNRISNIVKVDIKWKHIVTGFYNLDNKKAILYNYLVSIVAYTVFKENIHAKDCGNEAKDIELSDKIKGNIMFYKTVFKIHECRIFSNVIDRI